MIETLTAVSISTTHLSMNEGIRDNPEEWPTRILHDEYGFIVYIGSMADLENAITNMKGLNTLEDWPGLIASARWATVLGFQWINFDRDAETQPGLPTHDW